MVCDQLKLSRARVKDAVRRGQPLCRNRQIACASTTIWYEVRPLEAVPWKGARKNLVKDWMPRSAMVWTKTLAEAIVKLT